jgi:hypothetical protein
MVRLQDKFKTLLKAKLQTLGVIQLSGIMTCRPVAGQRLGKHIRAATNTQVKIDTFRCYATRLQQ